MLEISADLDQALEDLKAAGNQWAIAEDAYRKKKATEFLLAKTKKLDSGKTPSDKYVEMMIDEAAGEQRLDAHLWEGEKVACLERVRSLRTKLSALQTIANAWKTEMELSGRVFSD